MKWKLILCGLCAGTVSGLLGAGSGMILVPLLSCLAKIPDTKVFTASLSITLPICVVSLLLLWLHTPAQWAVFLPYLLGGSLGGILAGRLGSKIPTLWLHRILGGMILFGGLRYLC